jgi:hypothetical protein
LKAVETPGVCLRRSAKPRPYCSLYLIGGASCKYDEYEEIPNMNN